MSVKIPPLSDPSLRSCLIQMNREIQRLAGQIGKLKESNAKQLPVQKPNPVMNYDAGSNITLTTDDLGLIHHINATANIDVQLPAATEVTPTMILNRGTSLITLKNDSGTTMATLYEGHYATVQPTSDSSNTVRWPDRVFWTTNSGSVITLANVVAADSDVGDVVKDTNGDYWRFTVDTSGAWVSTNIGSSLEDADTGGAGP